jgi:hypothetical protein
MSILILEQKFYSFYSNRRNKSLTPPYLMDYYTNEYPHPGTKVLLLLFNRSVSVAIRQIKQTYVYNIHISFSQSFCFNRIFTASKHHFIASKYHFTNKVTMLKDILNILKTFSWVQN